MRMMILARQRDQADKRTLCIVRHAERSHVALIPRPGQLVPLDDGAYEAAWSRLCEACEPAQEEA